MEGVRLFGLGGDLISLCVYLITLLTIIAFIRRMRKARFMRGCICRAI